MPFRWMQLLLSGQRFQIAAVNTPRGRCSSPIKHDHIHTNLFQLVTAIWRGSPCPNIHATVAFSLIPEARLRMQPTLHLHFMMSELSVKSKQAVS
jgi:hypothetical protein